ncbi:5'-nucleotidase C-terminal domain-containing protein, partial [Halorubrum lacusprofundi]|uniref:5'-nucleotidase C-terminal domain-containing protein n=1 Tax=Halorubrum lacusprofundi TaxID=2247 RepID=UPI001552B07F
YKDIHRICPHPVNPVVVELKGDELLEVVRASLTKDLTELKLKGFGFRGEIIGKMIFSGMEIETVVQDNGHEYVKNVWLDGSPLVPEQVYSVATADIFTFGRLLPEVARSETKKYYLPEFMRDLLAETLKKHFGNH